MNNSIENTSQKMTKQFSFGGMLTAAPQITISPAMLTPLWKGQEVPNLKKHKRIGGGRCVVVVILSNINVVFSQYNSKKFPNLNFPLLLKRELAIIP